MFSWGMHELIDSISESSLKTCQFLVLFFHSWLGFILSS